MLWSKCYLHRSGGSVGAATGSTRTGAEMPLYSEGLGQRYWIKMRDIIGTRRVAFPTAVTVNNKRANKRATASDDLDEAHIQRDSRHAIHIQQHATCRAAAV